MKIRLSAALAHLNQLIEQGCEFPQAVYDTSVAYDLDRQAVEMLENCYDFYLMSTAESQ